jgi:hypothetical protein
MNPTDTDTATKSAQRLGTRRPNRAARARTTAVTETAWALGTALASCRRRGNFFLETRKIMSGITEQFR